MATKINIDFGNLDDRSKGNQDDHSSQGNQFNLVTKAKITILTMATLVAKPRRADKVSCECSDEGGEENVWYKREGR
jgi:hypothetical protein